MIKLFNRKPCLHERVYGTGYNQEHAWVNTIICYKCKKVWQTVQEWKKEYKDDNSRPSIDVWFDGT